MDLMDKMNWGLPELYRRLEEAKTELNATPFDEGPCSPYKMAMRKVNRLDARIERLEAQRGK